MHFRLLGRAERPIGKIGSAATHVDSGGSARGWRLPVERTRREDIVKIVARIEKIASDRYVLDGRMFDSFLAARRAMVEEMRRRRLSRRSVRPLSSMQAVGA